MFRLFGKLHTGVETGWGKNRSIPGPFFKRLRLQIRTLQRQPECKAVIKKHAERALEFLARFDVLLDLVIQVYFNVISLVLKR